MTQETSLKIVTHPRLIELVLNRPTCANAMSIDMIAQIRSTLDTHRHTPILLRGNGKHFCSGADLGNMAAAGQDTTDSNLAQARLLADMLEAIHSHPAPVVSFVRGAAYGGGFGLAAASDIILVTENARFCLPEVRLGLVPAAISPYIAEAIGTRRARRYALTTEVISAQQALDMGLASAQVEDAEAALAWIAASLQHAPLAMEVTKRLFGTPVPSILRQANAEQIAASRAGEEAQLGIQAHHAGTPPPWEQS